MKMISVLAGLFRLVSVVRMAIGDVGNAAAFGPTGHGRAEE
ncbi:hypothetical protein [Halogranum rubrum]|nr:hypothetical protein [Halogranum rubrum]